MAAMKFCALSPSSHNPVCRPLSTALSRSSHNPVCRPLASDILRSSHNQLCRPVASDILRSSHNQLCRPVASDILRSSHNQLCRPVASDLFGVVPPFSVVSENRIYANSDGSADDLGRTGGAVSWVLRNKDLDVIAKGGYWFSGAEFAKNTDHLELLGIRTAIQSISEDYYGFVVELYSDSYNAIKLIETVKEYVAKGYSAAGISARVMKSYRPSMNVLNEDMVAVAYDICMLMQKFHSDSEIRKNGRGVNLLADGVARYVRGYIVDKQVFFSNLMGDGVVE